jgi:LysR family glycine cleavage system transcriptional activator
MKSLLWSNAEHRLPNQRHRLGKTSDLPLNIKLCLKCSLTKRLPPLQSLQVFEASARLGNFSRAAAELGVTPAAVSLRIRNLESDLGTGLFKRNGPRVTLTDAGTELALSLADALALMKDAIGVCRSKPAPLRVSVAPTLARRWLVARLARYQQLPGAAPIKLDASTDVREPTDFDIALRSGRGPWPGLHSEVLLPILRTPMLSPGLADAHSLSSPADLARVLLLRDANWPGWFRAAGANPARLHYSPIDYETQDVEAAAAARGAGVALLHPMLFLDMITRGELRQPFPIVLDVGDACHLVRVPGDRRPEVEHFAAWLRQEARSTLAAYAPS